jgi:hypothetical protein
MVGKLIAKARSHEAQILALLPADQRPALKPILAALLGALPGNPVRLPVTEASAGPVAKE